jgi:hypothetical protein
LLALIAILVIFTLDFFRVIVAVKFLVGVESNIVSAAASEGCGEAKHYCCDQGCVFICK